MSTLDPAVTMQQGPLSGLRVIELAGIGPGPFTAMLLADLGADVLSVDRPVPDADESVYRADLLRRGRQSVAVDLKSAGGSEVILRLVEQADVLIEGFRPGVTERLGVGPDACMERNARLVYGRMTGWGQHGPYADQAGHDINYIAMAGALHAIGEAGRAPVPPLNLVGDFGGGGLMLAVGVLAAVFEAQRSGHGQVIDAAMVDGAALLMTLFHGMIAARTWTDVRGSNLLDGGAHFYGVYETSDGGHIALGSIEPQFYSRLVSVLGLDLSAIPPQDDRTTWPVMREEFARRIRKKSRNEWAALLDSADLCFSPVMGVTEAADHPHMVARGTFIDIDGIRQPAPAPRFSRTPGSVRRRPSVPGEDTREVLLDWGFNPSEVYQLEASGTVVPWK